MDLGKWASGGYVISTPVSDPEELMDIVRKEEPKWRKVITDAKLKVE